jgi:hypothetical protein
MCVSPLLKRTRRGGVGNHNAPDETFLVLYLELLTNWCRDVKHGKRAGNVKEQCSKSKVPARANSANECAASGMGHE